MGEQFTIGQKYFLAENSEILMLAISSILEADFVKGKKGMHWSTEYTLNRTQHSAIHPQRERGV